MYRITCVIRFTVFCFCCGSFTIPCRSIPSDGCITVRQFFSASYCACDLPDQPSLQHISAAACLAEHVISYKHQSVFPDKGAHIDESFPISKYCPYTAKNSMYLCVTQNGTWSFYFYNAGIRSRYSFLYISIYLRYLESLPSCSSS